MDEILLRLKELKEFKKEALAKIEDLRKIISYQKKWLRQVKEFHDEINRVLLDNVTKDDVKVSLIIDLDMFIIVYSLANLFCLHMIWMEI